jgi:hypothetical protein
MKGNKVMSKRLLETPSFLRIRWYKRIDRRNNIEYINAPAMLNARISVKNSPK